MLSSAMVDLPSLTTSKFASSSVLPAGPPVMDPGQIEVALNEFKILRQGNADFCHKEKERWRDL